jgi:hypothetical protein
MVVCQVLFAVLHSWTFFYIHVTVIRDKFPYNIKSTRCTNFSNLFWNETLHVSDSSSVHHQEFFTVHSAMVYIVQVCRLPLSIAECTVNNS